MRLAFAGPLLLAGSLPVHASSLTIYHNNDGESKLFGDASFGGVAYFKTTLDNLRALDAGRDQLILSSGEDF